ncbi:Ig-like domain-containing protein [Xenorhabdus ishibashii]|uniref:Gamma intimin n=1 Tax=Xenorhabdus ishibashii TaxID=1034471 RepID=A0A2D0KF62_9GAMM|nr:Ig-like domain-containing protein [Xenorhabdus ishibashii]PHM62056.1 Gamma intimin [Xenorhabdus ishibashii]
MLSYIGKAIFLLFFLYTLLVPYTITNSFAEGDRTFITHSISKNGIKSEELTSLSADGYQQYQFMATILDTNGSPVKAGTVIKDAHWNIDKITGAAKSDVILTPETKTDGNGNLKAILTSTQEFSGNVVVSLKVGTQSPVQSADSSVEFKPGSLSGITPHLARTPTSPYAVIYIKHPLEFNATDSNGNVLSNKTVNWEISVGQGGDKSAVTISPASSTSGHDGKVSITLTSTKPQTVTATASVDGRKIQTMDVKFILPESFDYDASQIDNSNAKQTLSVKMQDPDGNAIVNTNGEIPIQTWLIWAFKQHTGDKYGPATVTTDPRFIVSNKVIGDNLEGQLSFDVTDSKNTNGTAMVYPPNYQVIGCFGVGRSLEEAQTQVIYCDESSLEGWFVPE